MPRVTQRKADPVSSASASATSSRGVALRPPRYGIDFADRAGQALPSGLRSKMEQAFASDFSSVRVHHGSRAASLGAVACIGGARAALGQPTDLSGPSSGSPGAVVQRAIVGNNLAGCSVSSTNGNPFNVGLALERGRVIE